MNTTLFQILQIIQLEVISYFPFAGFFLHCKYILFVNLQIFFLLICEEDFFLSNISQAKVLFYVVVVFFLVNFIRPQN
jgi:hypothetical protein